MLTEDMRLLDERQRTLLISQAIAGNASFMFASVTPHQFLEATRSGPNGYCVHSGFISQMRNPGLIKISHIVRGMLAALLNIWPQREIPSFLSCSGNNSALSPGRTYPLNLPRLLLYKNPSRTKALKASSQGM